MEGDFLYDGPLSDAVNSIFEQIGDLERDMPAWAIAVVTICCVTLCTILSSCVCATVAFFHVLNKMPRRGSERALLDSDAEAPPPPQRAVVDDADL